MAYKAYGIRKELIIKKGPPAYAGEPFSFSILSRQWSRKTTYAQQMARRAHR